MKLKDVKEAKPTQETTRKTPKPVEVEGAVNLQHEVGLTAGKVWQALSAEGPQTVSELKKKLDGSADYLTFALGWLARESKVDIIPEKKTYRVSLR